MQRLYIVTWRRSFRFVCGMIEATQICFANQEICARCDVVGDYAKLRLAGGVDYVILLYVTLLQQIHHRQLYRGGNRHAIPQLAFDSMYVEVPGWYDSMRISATALAGMH